MPSLKPTILLLVTLTPLISAHAFFHKAFVNGADQGQLFGVRAPSSNSPITDVSSSAITCNAPLNQPVSHDVISVAPGDTFGMQWNHNIGGPTPGDGDDPIAASHKGPIMAYMAKVDDAASADGSGLSWFKVAEEGLDTSTGKWAVDTMIAAGGLWSFKIPNLAAGEYLMRGELLALHSAYDQGGAQFYMSCVAIKVTGDGTCSPSDTVSFPGAYSPTDPGIMLSIYGNSGQPDNGGKPYPIPGPDVAICGAGSAPPASSSKAAGSSSAAAATTSAAATSAAPTTAKPTSVVPTSAAATSAAASSTTAVYITDKPTTNVAVPTSAPVITDSTTPLAPIVDSTTPSVPESVPTSPAVPVEASTSAPVPVEVPSSTSPVSFTSTVTGRIGKPTKFTCYIEE